MRTLLFVLFSAFIGTPVLLAQTTPLSIVSTSNPGSDYNFFDIYKLNVNTGAIQHLYRHAQAFGAMLNFEGFRLGEHEELVVQFRNMDRTLIDEFSCRARYPEAHPHTAELIVIDPAEGFVVSTGMSYGQAMMLGAGY